MILYQKGKNNGNVSALKNEKHLKRHFKHARGVSVHFLPPAELRRCPRPLSWPLLDLDKPIRPIRTSWSSLTPQSGCTTESTGSTQAQPVPFLCLLLPRLLILLTILLCHTDVFVTGVTTI